MQLIFSCNYCHLNGPSFQTLIPLYCSPIHYMYVCAHACTTTHGHNGKSVTGDRFLTRLPNEASGVAKERAVEMQRQATDNMCVCLCVVNDCVDCRPLEEPAPCEYPPWQPATLGRFAQLSSSSCAVVKQTSSGALHSTCTIIRT